MPTPTNGEPIGTLAIDSYDVETAKNHLVNGFFKIESPNSDYRQRLGEALIVYRRTGEKNTIEDMIMVSSDSYYYREQMIGEKGIDIDVSFQMRLLAKQARLSFRNEEAKNSFLAKFVLYRDIAKDWADNDFLTSLNDRKFLYTWNSFYNVSDKNLDLVEERIKIASYNLLICLPAILQKKHALVLDNYLKEINNLKFWIISLRNSYSSYRFLGKRIPQMIQAAAKESNFTNAITRYLNNENEASLSAMLRIHREYHTQTSPEAPIGQNSPIEGKDKKKRIKIVKKDKKMSDDKKSSEQGVIRPMINFE
jgi:hypothetical protein